MDHFEFEAALWLHEGEGGWHFITVPEPTSDEIEARQQGQRHGFGSVPVRVTIGSTTWSTSLFPDSKRQAYVLPVKKEVRRREGISDGSHVAVRLELSEA